MKTRRFIAIFAALTMAAAIGSTSVFAVDDTTLDKDNASGTMTATYDADAKYTVTIPAGVTLSETADVTKNIAASDVRLESGQKIKVTLYGASNTESGSTFNAKTEAKDSTATYTITAGENAVEVGGTVAEFNADGEQALTFSKAEGATLAGKHTEVLTFGVSVESASKTVNLSTLTADYEAQDGDILTGTLAENYKITVADGASVTLKDLTINGTNDENLKWAGITLDGDGTLVLEGENTVQGFYYDYPGILVPEGKTLTIKGDGSIDASSTGYGAGIGGGYSGDENISCGNIVIESGTVNATGGEYAAGIGSGYVGSCGYIIIKGGTVNATGGKYTAGIGSGLEGFCGDIIIKGGTVNATGSTHASGIGTGYKGSCGDINIAGGTIISTSTDMGAGIGAGADGSCENITISGGTVTATGGDGGAGIGSGYNGSCNFITIKSTVTKVTATKGEYADNSIGAGYTGGSGTVTIEDESKVTQN